MQIYKVLEKPLVTEKSTRLQEVGNWVVFQVHLEANKIQIKRAVEEIFGVTVLKVNTSVVRGRWKRFGKNQGHSKTKKKAMLQLKEGDRIEVFEG